MYYKKTDERAIQPRRAHKFDAGLDLFALEDVRVSPGEVVRVKTGIHIANYPTSVALYWDKSGRASNGLTILGGCIDGPYRGELEVVVTNVNIKSTLAFLEFRLDNLIESRNVPTERYEYMLQKAVAATVTVPYGKALTQFIAISKTGLEFPALVELNEEDFEQYMDTERGVKGFSSSDVQFHSEMEKVDPNDYKSIDLKK